MMQRPNSVQGVRDLGKHPGLASPSTLHGKLPEGSLTDSFASLLQNSSNLEEGSSILPPLVSPLNKVSSSQRPNTATLGYSHRDGFSAMRKAEKAGIITSPQVDFPQRLGTPGNYNVPDRSALLSRDAHVRESFSSRSRRQSPSREDARGESRSSAFGERGERLSGAGPGQPVSVQVTGVLRKYAVNNNTYKTKLNDYKMIAFSSRRAGRTESECKAYFSMGVLYDNMREWKKAAKQYLRYLELCKELNDIEGESLAYNCIGVDYFNMAMGGSKAVASNTLGIHGDSSVNENLARKAVKYHEMHYESSDPPGKFVALCNLGLAHSKIGQLKKAKQCHEEALSLANSMQSAHGKSIAVGNLALIESMQGNYESAKTSMGKHLHLARDLQNWSAESLAYQKLGEMSSAQGDHQQATSYFEEARRVACNSDEKGIVKFLDCSIGVAQGSLRLKEYMSDLLQRAAAK